MIAAIFEVPTDFIHPSVESRPAVLDDDPLGLEFPDDTGKLKPQAGVRASKALAFACAANVLTRKPTCKAVDGGEIMLSDFFDI